MNTTTPNRDRHQVRSTGFSRVFVAAAFLPLNAGCTPSTAVALDAAWPAWIIALAASAVLLLAWWTYRAGGPRSGRAKILAALRALAALLLLLVLARPTLLLSRELRPKPVLTLAVDTSASMARADAVGSDATTPLTRLAAVTAKLADKQGALLRQLSQRYQLHLAAVSDRVVSRCVIDTPRQVPQALAWLSSLAADGPQTDLATAIHEALAATDPDRTLSGLVLLSDGRRSAGAPLTAAAEALRIARCAAIAVPAGSDTPLPDLLLADVQAPPRAFVGEPVAVRGRLESLALKSPVKATLQLIDESAGKVLAEQAIDLAPAADAPGATGEFTLMYQPDAPGLAHLLLKVRSPLPELNLRNNQVNLQIEAVDAKIRVLYVERESRFEYRYLKNLLVREPMVQSSVLLLSADPDFPQEGTEPIRRFPASLEELDRYDVVLLGDVDPKGGWIDPAGIENLAKWVEQKGGGLAWMAGPRVDLRAWHATALGKVLPVRPAEMASVQPPSADPFHPVLTPEGIRSSIFILDPRDPRADQGIATLPEWFWAASAGPATPAAQTLLTRPRGPSANNATPLVVTGHYGAGQTFYCGSDEMWRWRRFRDIDHWRSFWLQTVRWLAAPRKLGAYRKVVLEVTPDKVQAGQPVTLDLRVHDETLAADLPDRLAVTIRHDADPVRNLWLQRPPGLATYTGSITSSAAATYTAEVKLPAATQPATATFTVQLPEAETADSPADVTALRQWVSAVEQAGGQGYLLELDKLDSLASLPLPPAEVKRQTMDIPLWDNWLALLLVTGLFLAEWAWRRARGMA